MKPHRPKAVYVGKTTRVPPTPCLECGKVVDAGTGVGSKAKPHAGAICICLACGHLQAYAWDLSFRELTDEEILGVAGDERIVKLQAARAAYAKWKAKRGG